jgi:pimeloyl-ACP methyl ester carboxylesterase
MKERNASATKLCQFAKRHLGERRVIIMSHSTGAMLVWPIINKHPEMFSAWINARGCLQLTGNSLLKEFSHGWNVNFVKCLCPKRFILRLPASIPTFNCLVRNGAAMAILTLVDKNGNFVDRNDVDIFDVTTWEKYKLGIYGWKEEKGGSDYT